MKSPCGDCPDKGCGKHSECEKYQEFDKERQAERKKNYNERMIDGYILDDVVKSKRKYERRKR